MKRIVFLAALIVLSAVVLGSGTENGEWRHYSGDLGATKYSPLDQINRNNVSRLKIAWRRPHIEPEFLAANPELRSGNNFRSTPIMVDGVLYASNGAGLAEAIDSETGSLPRLTSITTDGFFFDSSSRSFAAVA